MMRGGGGEFGGHDAVALAFGIDRGGNVSEAIPFPPQRPIFERRRGARNAFKPSPLRDQPEQTKLQTEPSAQCGSGRRLAGFIVDHRKASLRHAVDPVELPCQRDACNLDPALLLDRQHRAPCFQSLGDLASNPVDRLQQARLPQRPHHRVGTLVGQHPQRARAKQFRIALIHAGPFFQHIMHRRPTPRRAGIGIDGIQRQESQDALGVKGIGVGLEPVDIGHGNACRAKFGRRHGGRLRIGTIVARRVQRARPALQFPRAFEPLPRQRLQA